MVIAQAANRITSRPTMTKFVSTARLATPMTHDEITIQMPRRMLMTSSQAWGTDTAAAENSTITAPRIHAFHEAAALVATKPITHGEMNSQMPISRLSQSCQRLSFMTYLQLLDICLTRWRKQDSVATPRRSEKICSIYKQEPARSVGAFSALVRQFKTARCIRLALACLARHQYLGCDGDGDRARLLAADADVGADRAVDARECLPRDAARFEATLELGALGLRADEAEIAPVVAGERRFDQCVIERVAVRGHDDEGARRRVRDLVLGRIGRDDLDVRGDMRQEIVGARIDPSHLRGNDAEHVHERASDMPVAEHQHEKFLRSNDVQQKRRRSISRRGDDRCTVSLMREAQARGADRIRIERRIAEGAANIVPRDNQPIGRRRIR